MNIVNLLRMDYAKALAIQEKVHEKRVQGKIGNTLLMVEHPAVLTLGRRGVYSNILLEEALLKSQGIEVFEVSRGGDVTYHGPGQIVGYPIVDLADYEKDIKIFVENIENVFIQLLHDKYNIEAHREEKKYTGVWVGNEKITAIGIAVKKWVTMHGFAFNVNTNLEHFRWINPCGITDKGVTSLEKLTNQKQNFAELVELVVQYFCNNFKVTNQSMSMAELEEIINGS